MYAWWFLCVVLQWSSAVQGKGSGIRQRRSASPGTARQLTSTQRNQLLNLHNEFRRTRGAANMQYLEWSSTLADLAVKWAVKCDFNHGQPSTPANTTVGQNLFSAGRDGFSVRGAVEAWFNESAHYDYNTKKCDTQACAHYTQVVWGASREVGCGYAFCPQLTGKGIAQAYFVVCNYAPAGNEPGKQPYVKGDPCTKCHSGRGECYKGLCRDCSKDNLPCACRVKCYNCGRIIKEQCRCRCPAGWHGGDCSEKCEDKHASCKNINSTSCELDSYKVWAPTNCPALCGVCEMPTKDNPEKCEPVQATGYSLISSISSKNTQKMSLLSTGFLLATILLFSA